MKSSIHTASVAGAVTFAGCVEKYDDVWWAWVGLLVCCALCGVMYELSRGRP